MRSSVQQAGSFGRRGTFDTVKEELLMRSIIATIALATTLIVCTGPGTVQANSDTGAVVIGAIDIHTGETYLHEDILRRQFKDGGVIEGFVVRPLIDGYNLLRIGYDTSGDCHTEALPLKVVGKKLVFHELKWFTTCLGAACSFCAPNYHKTACECASGGDCTFGMDVGGMGLDVVVIY